MLQAIPTSSIDLQRFAPRSDRDRVEAELRGVLAQARRRFASNAHVRPMYDHLTEFVLRGGKRLRPRLCLAAYRIISGEVGTPPKSVRAIASSLELFHAFMLIHDDLIDGSVLRRNRPTLHEAIRLDGPDPESAFRRKQASDLGLIAGDLLFALALRQAGRADLPIASLSRVQRIIADMLLETGIGEALDILYDDCPPERLSESQIVEAYIRKTGRYSISGPLVLGAALGGAPMLVGRALRRFGDLLGVGYQIGNDLQALEGDVEHGDHSDLDGGKRTYLLWAAFQGLDAEGRRTLVRALDEPVSVERRRRLRELIRRSGAEEIVRSRLKAVQKQAVDVLRSAPLSHDRKLALAGLTELFAAGGVLNGSTATLGPDLAPPASSAGIVA